MPPMKTKRRATAPAEPMNHVIILLTKSVGLTQPPLLVAQFSANEPALPIKAMRMVFNITVASITMARPIKAWDKVRLALMTLLASPLLNIYR